MHTQSHSQSRSRSGADGGATGKQAATSAGTSPFRNQAPEGFDQPDSSRIKAVGTEIRLRPSPLRTQPELDIPDIPVSCGASSLLGSGGGPTGGSASGQGIPSTQQTWSTGLRSSMLVGGQQESLVLHDSSLANPAAGPRGRQPPQTRGRGFNGCNKQVGSGFGFLLRPGLLSQEA